MAMISSFFHTAFYQPLYNLLVFLLSYLPSGSVVLAVILLTIIVKFILLPLSISAARTQLRMKDLEPKLKTINEKHKDNWQQRALETNAVYKEFGVRPLSSIFLILLQFPVIIALYSIFLSGGLPEIHLNELYTFIHAPIAVSTEFFGFFDVTKRSIILAVLAAIGQYVQNTIVLPPVPPKAADGKKEDFKDEFARTMRFQMRFVLPIIIGFVAYAAASIVAIYFLVGSIFATIQDILLKRSMKKVV